MAQIGSKTPDGGPVPTYPWAEMIDDFRQFGGVIDNVIQLSGPLGNGLFPMEAHKEVLIRVPEALLIDVTEVGVEDGDLVILPSSRTSPGIRDFFAKYQRAFSWGAEGRARTEAFERGLRALPQPLLERLFAYRLLDLDVRHSGEWSEVLKRGFVQSRRFVYNGMEVLMPVLELANHTSTSAGFKVDQGVAIEGVHAGEITVNYSVRTDPLHRFFTYGFASPERIAYSLPLKLEQDGVKVEIRNRHDRVEYRDALPLPSREQQAGAEVLAYLAIGMDGAPRLPRTVMRKVLEHLPESLADTIFERARSANITVLCDLLELSESGEGSVCKAFRQAVIAQLKCIAHCFGSRPASKGTGG